MSNVVLTLDEETAACQAAAPIEVRRAAERAALSAYRSALRPHSVSADPFDDLLDNLERYAVSTGISDASVDHDHYLYGLPKRA